MAIKILASGQSNMIGFSDVDVPDFAGVSASVRVWNNVNPLGANGTAFVTAAAAQATGTFENTDANNPAVWFADKLARRTFGDVDLSLVARGASSISNWAPGDAVPIYSEITAVWTATGQAPADVFLWHQGERDVTLGTAVATYNAAFETLLTNLTTAGVLSSTALVLIGGLAEEAADKAAFNNTCLFQLTKKLRRGFACSSGLTTFDGVHFDAPSVTKLGAHCYYSAYLFANGR